MLPRNIYLPYELSLKYDIIYLFPKKTPTLHIEDQSARTGISDQIAMAAVVGAGAGAGVSITTPKAFANPSEPHAIKCSLLNSSPWKTTTQLIMIRSRSMHVRPVAAAPDKLSEKVEESIKNAQEACSDDPVSGECAAAWDEVEELSAAASHARDKNKDSDPLETYCKDNPETDECRTYDN
ncbi:hypothetical protein BUALT_Bualt13G0000800 [Buddleja alternifolia]|uniref:CP12 domain-containing protein n=1 Tax=Buddleja alternifolia TaxID=168488 RepID=A0AAV6WUC8_9LAMI|nr:hypothetical protein BUALT_Bualt13G0000800 [Buddleja alternifolia]